MSKELEELRRMARAERQRAWAHAKVIPARLGDTATAFAKRHPILAMGGAAAVTMGLIARHRRHAGIQGKQGSLPAALAAASVQFLPQILKLVGLATPPAEALDDEDSENGHERCEAPAVDFADSAARGSEPTTSHTSTHPL